VGHPPFAHSGEEALDREMQAYGERFNHNVQSLRVVDSLERHYPRFPGLNLTFEVREGIVKHSRDLTPGESALLDRYLPELRPPVEAQLIDLADEVAYNAADLDDAYESGLFRPDRIASAIPVYADILEMVETSFPGASERERFQESVRYLTDGLVSGLIEGTMAAARASGVTNVEAVRHFPRRIVGFSAAAAATSCQIKQFLQDHVYCSEELAADRRRSMGRLAHLFEYLMAHPDLLPKDYQEKPLHRAVCDYIAGMTDGYFLRVYNALLG
jgi:dGTPase